MKKTLFYGTIALLMLLTAYISVRADNPQPKQKKISKKERKAADIKNMVDKQTYYFTAQTALPMSMPPVQLSYGYDLKVTKDTITAYLPYYGRAYAAPIGNNDSGIQFAATEFEYAAEESPGGWNVTIKIKDEHTHGYQLSLFISQSGMTNLQITDNVRQSISFNGYISAKQ